MSEITMSQLWDMFSNFDRRMEYIEKEIGYIGGMLRIQVKLKANLPLNDNEWGMLGVPKEQRPTKQAKVHDKTCPHCNTGCEDCVFCRGCEKCLP